ncbi:MAG: hypothetical protein KDC80_24270 [Saprospiraceae bacterium]|nr:hypothetical protein [Saprospiraceae bacterium]
MIKFITYQTDYRSNYANSIFSQMNSCFMQINDHHGFPVQIGVILPGFS